MSRFERSSYDLAVVGAGMAGMATALFAAARGLSCIQIGSAGSLLFASGLLDLLGVHPVAEARRWSSPYEAVAALARDQPEHPLARVDPAAIRHAFEAFVAALGAAGLRYAPLGEANKDVLTTIGTIKSSYGVPVTMAAGAAALAGRVPCLLVDFRGLREFSAAQVVATLAVRWPGLRHARIEFPNSGNSPELYGAHLAGALESADQRARTIGLVKPLLGDAQAVGFPAVLGLARAAEVHAAFEAGLGVPVFEIPTIPTSVPGLRLLAALERSVSANGVERRHHARVRRIHHEAEGRAATIELDDFAGGERILARSVVLATGRFTGRGLTADRNRVRESILDLPVSQPDSRDGWHQRDFLAPAGHPINRAGLMVDDRWHPLDARGRAAWPGLFAVGSILAHQDWMRSKCGSGLAIATAWAAVEQVAGHLRVTGAEER